MPVDSRHKRSDATQRDCPPRASDNQTSKLLGWVPVVIVGAGVIANWAVQGSDLKNQTSRNDRQQERIQDAERSINELRIQTSVIKESIKNAEDDRTEIKNDVKAILREIRAVRVPRDQ